MTVNEATTRTVQDVMQQELMTVSREANVTDLGELFDAHQISGLPVTDGAGHIIGVVSLRDLVEHYAGDPDAAAGTRLSGSSDGEEPLEFTVPEDSRATVADVMSGQVHAVPTDATIAETAAKMLELGVHRLLVVDADGRHVGLVTTFDLLRALVSA